MKATKAAAAALSLALLGSCSPRANEGTGSVTFESPKAGPSKARFGDDFLDFTAPKLGGGQVVGTEFVGKDVAIWFWAPW